MFSPIKKIFTYIQKSASGSNMFGGAASTVNNIQKTANPKETNTEMNEDIVQQNESIISEETVATCDSEIADFDIELQIKPSILVVNKPKIKLEKLKEENDKEDKPLDGTKVVVSEILPVELDDELSDFVQGPPDLGNASLDDDELEKAFLELDAFEDKEVIVLNEDSPSEQIVSDGICEDPLAIDDFNPLEHESDNQLDTSSLTNDETETVSTDIIWLDTLDGSEQQLEVATIHNREQDQREQRKAALKKCNESSNNQKEETAEELRSDGGSDSGLGSETSTLQTTIGSIADSSQLTVSVLATPDQTPSQAAKNINDEDLQGDDLDGAPKTEEPKKQLPLRSNLKRRLDDVEIVEAALVENNEKSGQSIIVGAQTQKRQKRSINFDEVQVYYFPRQQGFGCVPTVGGCTLGMGARHIAFKTLTLAEHAAELRRAHRMQMQVVQPRGSSSDETEESEEDYLSDGSGSDPDGESNGFLQPVPPKQRRALLKAAGVRKIDASEKSECRDIRNSREVCGCSCREFCDPETCACSQAGIKCQVDRAMFPCGCSRDACGNTVGRVEFNPTRVRTHYIHTIMRLDLEQRQQQNPTNLGYMLSPNTAVNSSTAVTGNYYNMQPQSNYSSGYASPAYTPETPANYYQQQQLQQQALPSALEQQQTVYGTMQDLHTPPYQLDSLDSNLFISGNNATPSYGELLQPTYQNLSFGTSNSAQLASYVPYHHHQPTNTAAYLDLARAQPSGTFSSCAVPSVPPFGNATTTSATAHYHHPNALETTATISNAATSTFLTTSPASVSTGGTAVSSILSSKTATATNTQTRDGFISLSTPNASSSRISQINDLLHHNRNTTTALIAVSQSPSNIGYALNHSGIGNSSNCNHATNDSVTTADASIDTPPIEDAHKHCLAFEQLPPPLNNPTPIVAVMQPTQPSTSKTSDTTSPPVLPQSLPPPQARQPINEVEHNTVRTTALPDGT